jgi:hypothetical protein
MRTTYVPFPRSDLQQFADYSGATVPESHRVPKKWFGTNSILVVLSYKAKEYRKIVHELFIRKEKVIPNCKKFLVHYIT